MPVGPVKAISLHMQVHGVDAHIGVALEGQLVAPVWHRGIQAADLIVVPEIKHMSLSWKGTKGRKQALESCEEKPVTGLVGE